MTASNGSPLTTNEHTLRLSGSALGGVSGMVPNGARLVSTSFALNAEGRGAKGYRIRQPSDGGAIVNACVGIYDGVYIS